MKRDGVSVAFDLIFEEISSQEAQLNQKGALAFQQGRYVDADCWSAAGKKLAEFRQKLGTLKGEWSSGIDVKIRERVKVEPGYHIQPHKKGARTNLRITMPDNRVIQRPTAAQAMTDALDLLGVEDVKALDITVSGVPLVGTEPHPRYQQTPLGQYLVCTHSNTKSKKQMLERVAETLKFPIKVDVI